MKFVTAQTATFEVFFKGTQTLTFPKGTPELAIRGYIEEQHFGGNWQRSSLVLKEVKLKEKVFDNVCIKLNELAPS